MRIHCSSVCQLHQSLFNMRGLGMLYLLVSSCVYWDNVSGSLAEFFENLPQKISEAWNYTWQNIIDAIKKPVRIKRLGKLGPLKTTTTPAPATIDISLSIEEQMGNEYGRINLRIPESNTDDGKRTLEYKLITTRGYSYNTEMLPLATAVSQRDVVELETLENSFRGSSMSKLTIPHLKPPQWKSLDDWRRLQKPIYGGYDDDIRRSNKLRLPRMKNESELLTTTNSDILKVTHNTTELNVQIKPTERNFPLQQTLDPKIDHSPDKLYLPVISTPRNKNSRYDLSERKERKKDTEIRRLTLPKASPLMAQTTSTKTKTTEPPTEPYLELRWNLEEREKDTEIRSLILPKASPLMAQTTSTKAKTTEPSTEPYLKFRWNVEGSKLNFKYKWYVNNI